jgi:CRP/FNR family transcriptional regulator
MPLDTDEVRHIPLFATLGPEDLAHVARVAVERSYRRGDVILLEGDPAGALHYVRSGLVKIFKTSTDGKEQVLRLMGPGSTFNDVPAFDGGPNPASAAAIEPCTVYMLGSAELRRLLLDRPAVAAAAVQSLAGALRHLVELVERLSFRHVTSRVAKILLDQETARAQGLPPHRLTQQEMAAMAGTAREMVGRALKELEAAGAIELRQGRVTVLSAERLRLLL